MSGVGSQDLDLGICLGLCLRSWISELGSQDLDHWVWVSGFRSWPLGVWFWLSGV